MNKTGKEDRNPRFKIIMLMMFIFMINHRISNPQMKSIIIVILDTGEVDQKEESFNKRHKEQYESCDIIEILSVMIDLFRRNHRYYVTSIPSESKETKAVERSVLINHCGYLY